MMKIWHKMCNKDVIPPKIIGPIEIEETWPTVYPLEANIGEKMSKKWPKLGKNGQKSKKIVDVPNFDPLMRPSHDFLGIGTMLHQ